MTPFDEKQSTLISNTEQIAFPLAQNASTNRYLIAATSDNTRKAYQSDLRHYEQWGGRLPASTEEIFHYLNAFAEKLNPRTLSRRLIALKQWHRLQQFIDPTDSPMIRKTLRGIQRLHGKPKEKATPLLPESLIKMVSYLRNQEGLSAYRDSALLQLGFLGAFRRSELVKIRVEDIDWQPQGIEIQIKQSKTDPLNAGQYCVIPVGNEWLCAVRALKEWCERGGIKTGFIFRRIRKSNQITEEAMTAESVNVILKKYAHAIGLEKVNGFSSHSLRRGLATSASQEGVSLSAIMRQGRWKQVSTVMEYIDAAQRFEENAAGKLLKKTRESG